MAECLLLKGSGADLDVVTAGAGDVLSPKVIVDKDGNPLTGTLALSGSALDGHVLAGQTYYNTDPKVKRTGTIPIQPADAHVSYRQAWATAAAAYGDGFLYAGVRDGHFLNGVAWIKTSVPNLIPSNVREGKWISDFIGTMKDYSYLAVGQTSF